MINPQRPRAIYFTQRRPKSLPLRNNQINKNKRIKPPICGLKVTSIAPQKTGALFSLFNPYNNKDVPNNTGKSYCPTVRTPSTGRNKNATGKSSKRVLPFQPSLNIQTEKNNITRFTSEEQTSELQ